MLGKNLVTCHTCTSDKIAISVNMAYHFLYHTTPIPLQCYLMINARNGNQGRLLSYILLATSSCDICSTEISSVAGSPQACVKASRHIK